MNSKDWTCSKCSFVNFKSRTECKNCSGTQKIINFKQNDWDCSCGYKNFAKNTICNSCKKSKNIQVEDGDWACKSCYFMNFKNNAKCKKCSNEKGQTNTPLIEVQFVVDVSLSMTGKKIEQTKNSIKIIFDEMIIDQDYLSLMSFSDKVQVIQDKKQKVQTKIDDLLEKLKPDGYTAFFDAIVQSIQSSEKFLHKEIIILTDGKDNRSKSSEKLARETIKSLYSNYPNTHITIIGVGKHIHFLTMKHLCEYKNSHYIECLDSKIRNSFSEIARRVAQKKKDLYIQFQLPTKDIEQSLEKVLKLLNELEVKNVQIDLQDEKLLDQDD